MSRFFAATLLSLLAGCASSSLKHAGRKAIVYRRMTANPTELGTVSLHTGICTALDPANLHATIGGRPLKVVSAGSSESNPDGTCDPLVWQETAATPTSEAQTVVEIGDGSETIHVTFIGLNQPPTVGIASSRFVHLGSALEIALDSPHSGDMITRATFDPSGRASPSDWRTSGPGHTPNSWTVSVPMDAPVGPGTLTFDVASTLGSSCDPDVECTGPTLLVGHGLVSTVSQVPFTTTPATLKIIY